MDNNAPANAGAGRRHRLRWLPRWLKICAAVLVMLILLRVLGLQIFIEFELNGEPSTAALSEIETYFLPLGLLLIYFLLSWILQAFFDRDS